MIEREVSAAKRTVTYTMSAEQAKAIVEWYRAAGTKTPANTDVQAFMEPLFAVSENREYGGH